MVPMRFTFKAVMVKMTPVCEVSMVFPIEPGMIVVIIGTVVIVAMPGWIVIVRISRIDGFVDADLYTDLCTGRIDRQ